MWRLLTERSGEEKGCWLERGCWGAGKYLNCSLSGLVVLNVADGTFEKRCCSSAFEENIDFAQECGGFIPGKCVMRVVCGVMHVVCGDVRRLTRDVR